MTGFKGFGDDKFASLPLPQGFPEALLPEISDPDVLKLLLCAFPLMDPHKDAVRFFFNGDLRENGAVKRNFPTEERLDRALEFACTEEIFLTGEYNGRRVYFLNTPRSSAALRAMQKGVWVPEARQNGSTDGWEEKPNIFALYEKNIGPLTPILAETLEDAEKEYPADWLEEAVKIAVKKNVRNWQYIEAILRSWKEKGRGEKDQRNHKEDARKYIEGDLADYIKH